LLLRRRCSVGWAPGVLAAAPLVFLLAVSPVFLLAVHRCSGRRRARPPAHRPRRELRSARRLEARL